MPENSNAITEYSLHPFCKLVPMCDDTTFACIVESIKQDGLCEPIILYSGKILDGRTRYNACEKANVEPQFVDFETVCPRVVKAKTRNEKDAIAFEWVVSKNYHRRDLTKSQLAMIAAKLTGLERGETKNAALAKGKSVCSQREVAAEYGVALSQVTNAVYVLNNNPQKAEEVFTGKISVNRAYLETREQMAKSAKKKPSPFSVAVIDKAHLGKEFRKKIGALSRLIEQYTIMGIIDDFFAMRTTIENVKSMIEIAEHSPMQIPTGQLVKQLETSLKGNRVLINKIADVYILGQKTCRELLDALKKSALSEDEKGLLETAEERFAEKKKQIQIDREEAEKNTYTVHGSELKPLSDAERDTINAEIDMLVAKKMASLVTQRQTTGHEESNSFSDVSAPDADDDNDGDF